MIDPDSLSHNDIPTTVITSKDGKLAQTKADIVRLFANRLIFFRLTTLGGVDVVPSGCQSCRGIKCKVFVSVILTHSQKPAH